MRARVCACVRACSTNTKSNGVCVCVAQQEDTLLLCGSCGAPGMVDNTGVGISAPLIRLLFMFMLVNSYSVLQPLISIIYVVYSLLAFVIYTHNGLVRACGYFFCVCVHPCIHPCIRAFCVCVVLRLCRFASVSFCVCVVLRFAGRVSRFA